jgi:hypothetical protein
MTAEPERTRIFDAARHAQDGAVSAALPSHHPAPPQQRHWKPRIIFGLVAAGAVATILWGVFLGTLLARLAWSFF